MTNLNTHHANLTDLAHALRQLADGRDVDAAVDHAETCADAAATAVDTADPWAALDLDTPATPTGHTCPICGHATREQANGPILLHVCPQHGEFLLVD